jgi:type III restriction enzyme
MPSVLDSDFFDVNKLTVVASESYDSFAKALQNEIVESLSERPVTLTTEVLNNRVFHNEKGEKFVFDSQSSMDLIFDMKTKGYLDANYHITETLIKDVENKTYDGSRKV